MLQPDEEYQDVSPQQPSEHEEETPAEPTKRGRRGLYNQFFAVAVLSIAYLICGSAVGWTSPILYKMRYYGEPMNLTSGEASTMVTLFYVGNFAMPIPSGILADAIGRKTSLMVLGVIPVIAWAMTYFAVHVNILHTARFLIGLWAGAVLTIGPMYVGEISEPTHRGRISAIISIALNLGALLAFFVAPRVDYWSVAIIFGMFPVLMLISFIFIPESPLWLLTKDKDDKAWKSLSWLRAGNPEGEIRQELVLLLGRVSIKTGRPFRVMIQSKGTRKALITVEVLSSLQRLSGVSATVGYASLILPDVSVGVLSSLDLFGCIAIIWFIGAVIHPFLIDKFGRKPLIIYSSSGVAVITLSGAIFYYVNRHATPKTYSQAWMAFVLYTIYGVLYNIGLGPVVTTIQGEIFPPDLKAIASGFTAMLVAAASSVTTAIFPPIAEHSGLYLNFLLYCAACVGITVFSWLYLIETKGKSLNDIQNELHSKDTVAGLSLSKE